MTQLRGVYVNTSTEPHASVFQFGQEIEWCLQSFPDIKSTVMSLISRLVAKFQAAIIS